LDKIGPLARTAEDCATVLNAIAGPDPADPTTMAGARFPMHTFAPSRFHIGVLKGSTEGAVREDIRANFDASLKILADYADLEDVELPGLPFAEAANLIVGVEAAAGFEEFIDDVGALKLTAPEDHLGRVDGLTVSAVEYVRALRLRRRASREMDALLAEFDAIVAPTLPTVASPIDARFAEYFFRDAATSLGAVGNLCGLPAISVPNGFGERGLPTGLEFMGRAFEDSRVVATAAAYQARTDWHRRHPGDRR
jgi:aspartyl-tRNA(Asn)/glutamyl-tRNA(Gln) amidotransferase subunit A